MRTFAALVLFALVAGAIRGMPWCDVGIVVLIVVVEALLPEPAGVRRAYP